MDKRTTPAQEEAAAWLYASDDGSRELFLDCNHERARRLIEMGWTEQPLYASHTQEEAQPMSAQEAESELVARLRYTHEHGLFNASLAGMVASPNEAADHITRLEAALREAREALEPFKLAADMADDRMLTRFLNTDLPDDTTVLGALNLTLGHLRIARTAFGGGV